MGPRSDSQKAVPEHIPLAPGDALTATIFTDPEQHLAALSGAAAFTSMLVEARDDLANDNEVREIVYAGIEPLIYALDQLTAPSDEEQAVTATLSGLADTYARRRAAETAEIQHLCAGAGAA